MILQRDFILESLSARQARISAHFVKSRNMFLNTTLPFKKSCTVWKSKFFATAMTLNVLFSYTNVEILFGILGTQALLAFGEPLTLNMLM